MGTLWVNHTTFELKDGKVSHFFDLKFGNACPIDIFLYKEKLDDMILSDSPFHINFVGD